MRLIGLAVALAFGLTLAPIVAEAQGGEGLADRLSHPVRASQPLIEALRQSLRNLGYVEGSNIVIETRSAEQRYGDLPKLAAELVNANVDVIVAAIGPER